MTAQEALEAHQVAVVLFFALRKQRETAKKSELTAIEASLIAAQKAMESCELTIYISSESYIDANVPFLNK